MILKPLVWMLGSVAVIVAISAPVVYWSITSMYAAETACQKKGGIFYRTGGICLRPNAVVR